MITTVKKLKLLQNFWNICKEYAHVQGEQAMY